MKATLTTLLLMLCVLLGAVSPTSATWVTIYIEGVVDTVHDYGNYLEGQINVGDPITGYYTYDTDTLDTNPIMQVADYEYYSQPSGATLVVGGIDFGTDLTNVSFVMELINDYVSGSLHDSFGWISYNNISNPIGLSLGQLSWWLRDDTATALSGTGLPVASPVLEDWTSNVLRIEGYNDAFFLVQGHVTSAVPEPTTLLLIGLGTMGLIVRRTSKS